MPATLKLGDTEVARIGLGTNRLTKTPEHEAFVKEAVGAGIDFIDTAHLYTGGESEETIGAALAPFPEGVVVATKGAFHPGQGRPARARRALLGAAERSRAHDGPARAGLVP